MCKSLRGANRNMTIDYTDGSLCEYMVHDCLKTQPSFLSPGMHDRNRLLGMTVTNYIGPDGPQPLGSLTRAVQLELPPPNDIVEEK